MAENTPNIGHLAEGDAQRDAIHIAVAPVVAAQQLRPGEHVGLLEDGTASPDSDPVGLVDPYLNAEVEEGQRFWLFLYPGTITGLRHLWSHPAFTPRPPRNVKCEPGNERKGFLAALAADPFDQGTRKVFADWLDDQGEHEEADTQRAWSPEKGRAEQWLRGFAEEVGMSLDMLVHVAEDYLEHGRAYTLSFDTPDRVWEDGEAFWDYFATYTGRDTQGKSDTFFRCAC